MRSGHSTSPAPPAIGVLLALLPLVGGCGSRTAPLPPVYPNPPTINGLTVAQRGSFGILRFPAPELATVVGDEDVEIESVQVLVYAERYPVLTVDMLVAGLERRVDVMMQDARAAARAEAARARLEADTAAGIPPPEPDDPDAPVTTVRRRAPDEDAIHRVPESVLLGWQRQGLAPDAVLEAARRLGAAIDELWTSLGQPATILDPDQPPPPLPSPGEIAAASEPVLRQAAYERPLTANEFLGRAAVSRTIAVELFEESTVAEQLQVAVPLGTPAPGGLRTRYFFAVRSFSTDQTPGLVNAIVPLAPLPVPVPPAAINVAISGRGVELTWEPPAGDLMLRRLDPASITYRVYRLAPDGIAEPTPLHPQPLLQPTYTDNAMQWGETYVWEVRASIADTATPRRESDGARTDPIEVIDRFPPAAPSAVVPTRAGSRVTLLWTSSPSLDIVGYRVYRHPVPAPEPPLRLDPTLGEPEPGDPPVTQGPVVTDEEGRNQMLAAGWEMVVELAPFSRATDSDADPAVQYVYAVEAIDAAGNLSPLAIGSEAGERR